MRWTTSKTIAFVFALLCDVLGCVLIFAPYRVPVIAFVLIAMGTAVIVAALLDTN